MENGFTEEERKNFMLKNHIRNHIFEYLLDIIIPMLITFFLLYICKAEKYSYGILMSAVYSALKILHDIHIYKKDYIDIKTK